MRRYCLLVVLAANGGAFAQTMSLVDISTAPTTGADIGTFNRTTHFTFDLRGSTFGQEWINARMFVDVQAQGHIWHATDERVFQVPADPDDPNGLQCAIHSLLTPQLANNATNRQNTLIYDTFICAPGADFNRDAGLGIPNRPNPNPGGCHPVPLIQSTGARICMIDNSEDPAPVEWYDTDLLPLNQSTIARLTFVVPEWGALSRNQSSTHPVPFARVYGFVSSNASFADGIPYSFTIWQAAQPGGPSPDDCNRNGIPDTSESDLAPRIERQPADELACAGASTAIFTVSAHSPQSVQYQWRRNGAIVSDGPNGNGVILGSNGASLIITRCGAEDQGAYSVTITSECGEVVSRAAQLVVQSGMPTIASQPSSISVCDGESATLSVIPGPLAPAGYRWYRNGTEISGANSATYSVAAASTADQGTYRVELFRACGIARSEDVTITVRPRPSILLEPQSISACAGDAVTFLVGVDCEDCTIQWRIDGQPIGSAMSPALPLPSVTPADRGTYDVVVTRDGCETVSEPALLSVNVITGDIDYDGNVDLSDLSILLRNFGESTEEGWTVGDVNGDGIVNLTDLSRVLSHFGASC